MGIFAAEVQRLAVRGECLTIEVLVQNRWSIPFLAIVLENFRLRFFQVAPSCELRVIDLFSVQRESDPVHHDSSRICEQSRGESLWSVAGTRLSQIGILT